MAITYNAGIVTAYGAAVRGGYTGTYEEFCRQQAGYAQSAAAVEQAKEDVQELVEGIPADYTQLSEDVNTLKEELGDLSDLETSDKSNIVAAINEAAQSGGSSGGITVVDTVAEMVDTESVYLYNGTQTGYTAGHWYFYNTGTSAWTDGGQYTGWETVETALAEYLQGNAQEIGVLSVVIGGTTYRFNGSSDVSITLPIYNGGVS